MKLEKVVSRPRVGVWVFILVLGLLFAGYMATSYNVELVHDISWEQTPWSKIIIGAVGFIGIIGSLILFFARLLREMRISQVQAETPEKGPVVAMQQTVETTDHRPLESAKQRLRVALQARHGFAAGGEVAAPAA